MTEVQLRLEGVLGCLVASEFVERTRRLERVVEEGCRAFEGLKQLVRVLTSFTLRFLQKCRPVIARSL